MTSKDKPLGVKRVVTDGHQVAYLSSPNQDAPMGDPIFFTVELLRRFISPLDY
jgi:hypothetical protein